MKYTKLLIATSLVLTCLATNPILADNQNKIRDTSSQEIINKSSEKQYANVLQTYNRFIYGGEDERQTVINSSGDYEKMIFMEKQHQPNLENYRFTFYKGKESGQELLLVGTQEQGKYNLSEVYYLNNGKPELLSFNYIPTGSYRVFAEVYESGLVTRFDSSKQVGTAYLYKPTENGKEELRQMGDVQMNDVANSLGVSDQTPVDLNRLNWKEFGQGNSSEEIVSQTQESSKSTSNSKTSSSTKKQSKSVEAKKAHQSTLTAYGQFINGSDSDRQSFVNTLNDVEKDVFKEKLNEENLDNYRYTFYKGKESGQEVFIVAKQNGRKYELKEVYYINGGQSELLGANYGTGDYPVGITEIYEAGLVMRVSASGPIATAWLYKPLADGKEELEYQNEILTKDAAERLGMKDKPVLDLTTLNWHEFEKNDTKTEDTSSTSSEAKVEETTTTGGNADLNTLVAGDYSALKGTWVNRNGDTVVFDGSDSFIYTVNGITNNTKFTGSNRVQNIPNGDYGIFGIQSASSSPGGPPLVFYPAGMSLPSRTGEVYPYTEQDRIMIGDGFGLSAEQIYIRQ